MFDNFILMGLLTNSSTYWDLSLQVFCQLGKQSHAFNNRGNFYFNVGKLVASTVRWIFLITWKRFKMSKAIQCYCKFLASFLWPKELLCVQLQLYVMEKWNMSQPERNQSHARQPLESMVKVITILHSIYFL